MRETSGETRANMVGLDFWPHVTGRKRGPRDISRHRAAQAVVLRLWNRTIVMEGE
jgi:hypothetical protein